MSIIYRHHTFTSFQEYISNSKQRQLLEADNASTYAHPVDGWIINALNATPVKTLMEKILDVGISYYFGSELANSVFIDQHSFPDLFEVLIHCTTTLGIAIPHAVTRHTDTGMFNAYTAGTDDYAFIVISSALCTIFSKEEACFVIGHECGHIAARHMTYHTVVNMMTEVLSKQVEAIIPAAAVLRLMAGIPLNAWSRYSEITADRAGLLCCGDIKVAEMALLRLVIGVADLERVDIDDYLQKYRRMEKFHSAAKLGLYRFFETHPEIPRRIEALRLFANSEVYYRLSGKLPSGGVTLLNQQQLNQQVSQVLKS